MKKRLKILRERFLEEAWVKDSETGFINFDTFKNDPWITAQIAQVIARNCHHLQVDLVVGVARSGIRLAKEVAHALDLPFKGSWKGEVPTGERAGDYFPVRVSRSFTQGRPATIFFSKLERQYRVLVVDDVVAYANTGAGVIEAFRERGHTVVAWATEMAKLFQGGVERIRGLGVEVFVVIPVRTIDDRNRIILA